MSTVVLHSSPNLPLSTEAATAVFVVGFVVVALVAYDAYRRRIT